MKYPPYTFTIEGLPELAARLTKTFNERPVLLCDDPEVLTGICEILWRHKFEPSEKGMVRQSTGCSFSWGCLLKYKSVVDFQLEWSYA